MEKVAAQPTGAILLQRSHNAATAGTVNNLGGTWSRTDLERDYVSGPRGEYYYPESGGPYSLAQLRDAGSRSAWIAGLACATTRTDHAPDEGTVDIGFHYRLPDDPPVAIGPLEFSTCRNQDLELDLAPWAWSPSGCPLTWTLVPNAGPWHGTLLGTLPEVTYRPAPGYCGSDSFRFRASDGGQESEPATVNIYVGDAYPEAHCQDVMTGVNTPVAFTLSGTDACGETLDFGTPSATAQGGLLSTPTREDATHVSITYTPRPAHLKAQTILSSPSAIAVSSRCSRRSPSTSCPGRR